MTWRSVTRAGPCSISTCGSSPAHRPRVKSEEEYAGLLDRLAPSGPRKSGVLMFAVTARLEPRAGLGVQRQQNLLVIGRDDQRACCDVCGEAVPLQAGGIDLEMVDVATPYRFLLLVRRRPSAQQ